VTGPVWFVFKMLFSGAVIAFASSLAGKKPVLAGFIIALPMMSMMSLLFMYAEYRDMAKANTFALSVLAAVPLSLLFFLPFVLHRWMKLGFGATYLAGIVCVTLGYLAHSLLAKRFFLQ